MVAASKLFNHEDSFLPQMRLEFCSLTEMNRREEKYSSDAIFQTNLLVCLKKEQTTATRR